jgi:type IV secretory pathway TraG/TraD family ATPase VirD4
LKSLESAISEIQNRGEIADKLFSVTLDDFNDYIHEGFASILNKSRSANIGVVFSHQSMGDLEKVSEDFRKIVDTNTNIKVYMSTNDPQTAEHFANVIGTKTSEKSTERRTRNFFLPMRTGEESVREAEEYIIHPNVFKSDQNQGEGVVVIRHTSGRMVKRVKFSPAATLSAVNLPKRNHLTLDFPALAINQVKDAKPLVKTFGAAA